MKKRNILQKMVLGSILLVAMGACTDKWDEHYSVNPAVNPEETLWDLINANSELSEFATLLKENGYDKLLNANRYYTVWAPKNGFRSQYTEINDSLIVEEFIKNHVADYSHVASGTMTRNKIEMLNKKYMSFNGTANHYTFNNVEVAQANLSAKNGILHVIDGYSTFTANLWESLSKVDSLSLFSSYLHSFDQKLFSEILSVKGPIVDGKITYLDSVILEHNEWFSRIGYINEEDSSYSMIAPTNQAFRSMLEKAKTYFVFPQKKAYRDSLQTAYAKAIMCRHLVFSNTINSKPHTNPDDSLISNCRNDRRIFRYAERDELFKDLVSKTELSNGTLYVVDSLNYRPTSCWHDTIKIEGENSVYIEGTSCNTNYGSVSRDSIHIFRHVSNGGYGIYSPITSTGNPKITFTIPNTFSANYRIKCVFIPANVINKNITDLKPNKFTAQLKYVDLNGAVKTQSLGSDLHNDPTKIDTMTFIPNKSTVDYFKFPTNEFEAGLDLTSTQLVITSSAKSRETEFDRVFRLDCIILEPVNE